ncbi:hypothetical protein FSO04_45395 [Paraburkholderia madseniana]|uniref:Uncharacterized protein n=1 Tax=Paraburkholderia madseniana TaxID=2599607 RepID=A0A6N6VYF1_9BURK|nr:hypothetical protein [Paraburkholderia madseniana]KAE8753403.1 hypothetical protein FSO04_45395 [Paraburkholderia madseniana]
MNSTTGMPYSAPDGSHLALSKASQRLAEEQTTHPGVIDSGIALCTGTMAGIANDFSTQSGAKHSNVVLCNGFDDILKRRTDDSTMSWEVHYESRGDEPRPTPALTYAVLLLPHRHD